jgi:hypothetical protein
VWIYAARRVSLLGKQHWSQTQLHKYIFDEPAAWMHGCFASSAWFVL